VPVERSFFFEGFVSPGTFPLLGVSPLVGRPLTAEDFRSEAPPVFVMRYQTWVSRFGRDPNILNKRFIFDGLPHTLVGTMPPKFASDNREIWLPVPHFFDKDPRYRDELFLIARLSRALQTNRLPPTWTSSLSPDLS